MGIIRMIILAVFPQIKMLIKLAKLFRMGESAFKRAILNKPEFIKKQIENLGFRQRQIFADIMTSSVTKPKYTSMLLGAINQQARKTLGKLLVTGTQINENSKLYSSWLFFGSYVSYSQGIGELTLELISGRIYTWNGVPYSVWNAMKKARGRYGTGAGTVFWALFLRGYRKTFIGKTLHKLREFIGDKTNPPLKMRKLLGYFK